MTDFAHKHRYETITRWRTEPVPGSKRIPEVYAMCSCSKVGPRAAKPAEIEARLRELVCPRCGEYEHQHADLAGCFDAVRKRVDTLERGIEDFVSALRSAVSKDR